MKKQKKIILIFIVAGLLLTAGFRCKLINNVPAEATKPITLEYWRVFDDSNSLTDIINDYKAMHPNVSVKYKKFRYEEYEQKLLEALAEDKGPDIFSIHNTWVNKYKTKVEPMPKSVNIPFQETQGSIKKEVVTVMKTIPSISLLQMKNDFVEVAYNDCVDKEENKILCLPFGVDTLVLFFNRDLLNTAGIPVPPKTWIEFQAAVKLITKYDADNNIVQSAAAMGTSDNVSRFSDILSLLMMQNGAKMSEGDNITFQMPLAETKYAPGLEALKFYTAFAIPQKEVYTWNNKMPNSLDAFIEGQTAFFFGYSYNLPMIKAKAPKLNFGIATMPQISQEGSASVNMANYWVETISKKSKNKDIAWNFLQFAATEPKVVSKFLAKTKKPTALRALINDQLNDMEISPFASQVLTAKSWYHGMDSGAMETILGHMISQVTPEAEDKECQMLLNEAAKKIQQTMRDGD